jgi:hypothetical protein
MVLGYKHPAGWLAFTGVLPWWRYTIRCVLIPILFMSANHYLMNNKNKNTTTICFIPIITLKHYRTHEKKSRLFDASGPSQRTHQEKPLKIYDLSNSLEKKKNQFKNIDAIPR